MSELADAIDKLHLEPGDLLVVDGNAIDVKSITSFKYKFSVPIVVMFPKDGQSVRDAFYVERAK